MDGNVSSLKIARSPLIGASNRPFFLNTFTNYRSISRLIPSLAPFLSLVCVSLLYSFLKSLAVQTVRDHRATRETVSSCFCTRLGRRDVIVHLIFYYNDFFVDILCTIMRQCAYDYGHTYEPATSEKTSLRHIFL